MAHRSLTRSTLVKTAPGGYHRYRQCALPRSIAPTDACVALFVPATVTFSKRFSNRHERGRTLEEASYASLLQQWQRWDLIYGKQALCSQEHERTNPAWVDPAASRADKQRAKATCAKCPILGSCAAWADSPLFADIEGVMARQEFLPANPVAA